MSKGKFTATRVVRLPFGWTLGADMSIAKSGSWEIVTKQGATLHTALSLHLSKKAGRNPMLGVIAGPLAIHFTILRPCDAGETAR